MKVCIPFKINDVGGSSTFVKNFINQLKGKGIEITDNPKEHSDIFFVMTSRPLIEIWKAKQRGVKIVQRLDGVYYYAVHGIKYLFLNIRMRFIHQYLADYVIYQSKYSRVCCNLFLGQSRAPWNIIYNGIDTDMFSPDGPSHILKTNPKQIILISIGDFRRREQIQPLIETCSLLHGKFDIKLILIGSITSNLKPLVNLPFISLLDVIPNQELHSYLRGADIFLFSDRSACPNAVLEALACGLPVVAFQKGAMKELVPDGMGILIPYDLQNFFKQIAPSDYKTMAHIIEDVLQRRILLNDKYTIANYARQYFSLETMTENYLEIFHSLI
ncbi:hypothetical protein A3H10_03505 [Candidatus Uhrbacteria bacterium RIFCSPLOWO2_12_FULL_46_10]|uniref:Glycosyl transferase family 1 domain-containing protein n=1 Tax=Candidatus Uhrbacteria bacterium RIFCSPLOWO2_01_FULL_47_25 TaxID=1802402 RepID=A0A1F7URE1_9BACT|nr:MAG: Glycosyl transferase group 1 [Parcubacteria group bacterium GW2011_GWA2_46_9]OGL61019.1 MAG: hypothetical protein A2752_00805 [Candidatus Uhrbacteria bacterium RIFCSPHIGHO2_01_FULL_46_23]OGL69231.1 MAG: hypothetical protein A3D60_05010 [Candidatus Uhrbacteria bacterium RIFCSPHIGHO2_02_FULL_47_29]OGL80294.1 MAG: hypothetical protein A2936_02915 [Candidatus Uhrbacteria bacterium RIFCSPLOWO2_01_FULL_47_25]OGL85369.1 MAG: hypothetical protein A3I37_00820 [Candidatus Uhrbacteria bacterium RI